MKASVSLPDELLDAAKEVWPHEKLSHVVQRGLILLLAHEGYVAEHVPAKWIVHRPLEDEYEDEAGSFELLQGI